MKGTVLTHPLLNFTQKHGPFILLHRVSRFDYRPVEVMKPLVNFWLIEEDVLVFFFYKFKDDFLVISVPGLYRLSFRSFQVRFRTK